MTKKEFIKQLNVYFTKRGFYYRKDHFYKEVYEDVLAVIGLQKSVYGGYGYLEYGYCFKSINDHMPYPMFWELNLRLFRIMTSKGQAIEYENIDDLFMEDLEQRLDHIINNMISLSQNGPVELIEHYRSLPDSPQTHYWVICGEKTAKYVGLTPKDFVYHFIPE